MIVSGLISLIRMYVPGLKPRVVDDSTLITLINRGVDTINEDGNVWEISEKIDLNANDQEINISDVLSNFLTMGPSGIWYNQGTEATPDYIQLDPYTRKGLDKDYPNWRNDPVDTPLRYYIEGNLLGLHPGVSTALTDGLWMNFIRAANAITASDQYPFSGSGTEIPQFRVFDDSIIDYVRWKVSRPLGKDNQHGVISEADFNKSKARAISNFRQRLDIQYHKNTKMRIPVIG